MVRSHLLVKPSLQSALFLELWELEPCPYVSMNSDGAIFFCLQISVGGCGFAGGCFAETLWRFIGGGTAAPVVPLQVSGKQFSFDEGNSSCGSSYEAPDLAGATGGCTVWLVVLACLLSGGLGVACGWKLRSWWTPVAPQRRTSQQSAIFEEPAVVDSLLNSTWKRPRSGFGGLEVGRSSGGDFSSGASIASSASTADEDVWKPRRR